MTAPVENADYGSVHESTGYDFKRRQNTIYHRKHIERFFGGVSGSTKAKGKLKSNH